MLLERRGATTVHAPTVRTLPLVEGDQLTAAIDQLITDPPDIVVLLTGIGTRGLVAAAEGIGRDGELLEALVSSTVVARGPKAAGAATTVGFEVAWHADSERSIEIYERLRAEAAHGARIAVQRDGAATPFLADAFRAVGGRTLDIPVYRWELPLDTRPALRRRAAARRSRSTAPTRRATRRRTRRSSPRPPPSDRERRPSTT